MADFRRLFFALVLIAVVTATVSTAYGQAFQCTANAGVPARVRGEGRTELVGDLILNCSGAPAAAITANIQIFLSTNITSRIIDTTTRATEAMLTLGEPAPDAQVVNTNVFHGVVAGDNSLLWTNVPIIAPPGTTQTIRITNVRANAVQAFSQGQTFIPQQITMFVTVTSSTAIPINNPTQVVGAVLKGMDFALRNCGDTGGPATSFAQCSSVGSTDPASTSHALTGLLKFSEGFDAAFRQQIAEGQNGAALGTITNVSESGYVNTPELAANVGMASTGTRLIARFSGIPAGVSIFVTTKQVVPGTTAGAQAVLVALGDPTGVTGSASFPVQGTGTSSTACTGTAESVVQVPLFGGAGSATWEVQQVSVNTVETISFGYEIAYSARPDQNLPALTLGTPGTVTGNFAPISSVATASATAPIPRFADLPISRDLVNINACVTNLLFPFVSARSGFDTGVAISNTSLDNSGGLTGGTDKVPFSTTPQNGACTLYFFGDLADGTTPAKPVQTSSVVSAGKQLVFTLMSGGMGIEGMSGFQGYAIARCNFQFAHGFVFVSDVGARNLAMGYLPLIIPDRGRTAAPFSTGGSGTGEQLVQ